MRSDSLDDGPSGPPRRLTISLSQRTLWLAAGVVLASLVLVLLVAQAFSALLLIFLAITLAETIRPLVARLERLRVPRPLGAVLIYLVLVALFVGIGWLLLTPLVAQINELVRDLPRYLAQAQKWAEEAQQALAANEPLNAIIDGLAAQLTTSLQSALPDLLRFPLTLLSGAFGGLLSVVIVITMSIFWLMSAGKLREFVLSLIPEALRARGGVVFTELGQTLGGWVRGTLVAMLLIGLLVGLGLWLLGVPEALLLGIFAGLTEVIPYIGPWISGAVAALVALVAVDPLKALQVAILFILVYQVESNLVRPLVMSWAVKVDPLLVLIAVVVGAEALGLIGAVIALPVAGMLQVITQRLVAPAIRRATTANEVALAGVPDVHSSAPADNDTARQLDE
ncbi:MAG TPA: AI-2E family transporter [Ktedonobacterales bacterium]|nr:AI-2E family transporter [Ktedonobacterales bacterium]